MKTTWLSAADRRLLNWKLTDMETLQARRFRKPALEDADRNPFLAERQLEDQRVGMARNRNPRALEATRADVPQSFKAKAAYDEQIEAAHLCAKVSFDAGRHRPWSVATHASVLDLGNDRFAQRRERALRIARDNAATGAVTTVAVRPKSVGMSPDDLHRLLVPKPATRTARLARQETNKTAHQQGWDDSFASPAAAANALRPRRRRPEDAAQHEESLQAGTVLTESPLSHEPQLVSPRSRRLARKMSRWIAAANRKEAKQRAYLADRNAQETHDAIGRAVGGVEPISRQNSLAFLYPQRVRTDDQRYRRAAKKPTR